MFLKHLFGNLKTTFNRVFSIHQNFRLDNRDNICLLAQCGITRHRVGVRMNTAFGWNTIANSNHCAPFGESRAEFTILFQPLAQFIQSFRHLLAFVESQRFCAHIYFDAGENAFFREDFRERSTITRFLAKRLVIENDAADVFFKTFRGEKGIPICAAVFFVVFYTDSVKAFLDSARALVCGKNAFAGGDHLFSGTFQCFEIHTAYSNRLYV